MTEDILRKLEKIYQLATRGVAGEKEAAQHMLDKLMREHNIDIERLERIVQKEQVYEFPYFDKMEKSLLNQVYCRVMNVHSMPHHKLMNRKRRLYIKLTPTQYEQIDKRYKLLKNLSTPRSKEFFS